jgi:hypothetical protein
VQVRGAADAPINVRPRHGPSFGTRYETFMLLTVN